MSSSRFHRQPRWLFLLGPVLAASLLVAVKSAGAADRIFVDDLHRSVSVPDHPARVVSLAPSLTELLFALGLDREIVAVTPFCDYPPQAATKPKVGYTNPSIEALVGHDPDLVLAPREFMRADLLGRLEQLRIPALVFSAGSVADITAHLQTLGRIFHREPQAENVATSLRRQLDAIQSRVRTLPPQRVLYVLNSHPLITVGPGSFIHELIGLAGGQNAAAEAAMPYPRLSMEAVLKADPEVLLFPVGKTEGIPPSEQQVWRQWSGLSAVQQNRLRSIPSDLLNRPGPRIGEGLEALARAIHPEAFTNETKP
ncbi:MAG: cobalamin-binding protein [Nitrospiraceae bacterium]